MPPASGSAEVAHGSAQNGFTAVLFDWRGTLFHDESDQDWIRASAASIGRTRSDDEVDHFAKRLGAAAEHPHVRTAHERADVQLSYIVQQRSSSFGSPVRTPSCLVEMRRGRWHASGLPTQL